MKRASQAADDRPLTVAEVARYFRCDPETVKRQARHGALPAFKFGKFWYFRRSEIEHWMAAAVQSRPAIGVASVEE